VVSPDAFYKWPCDDLCGVLLPELPRARSPEASDFLSKLAKDVRTLRANSHREVIAEKRFGNGIRKRSSQRGFVRCRLSSSRLTSLVAEVRSYRCDVLSRQPRPGRRREAKEIGGEEEGAERRLLYLAYLALESLSASASGRGRGASPLHFNMHSHGLISDSDL